MEAVSRVYHLLDTLAAVRWVSCEPLLEELTFAESMLRLDWLVVGCETGPGRRPCKLEWVERLIKDATYDSVPVFVKQLDIGGKVSKNPAEWPEWARRREYPERRA